MNALSNSSGSQNFSPNNSNFSSVLIPNQLYIDFSMDIPNNEAYEVIPQLKNFQPSLSIDVDAVLDSSLISNDTWNSSIAYEEEQENITDLKVTKYGIIYPCKICYKEFTSDMLRRIHYIDVHPEVPELNGFRCCWCDESKNS